LDSGKTEIANLEITVLIDKNVAGLEITMYDTCGVDIFETTLDYVSCVLDREYLFVDIRGFGKGSTG
jgi:hypothetical protein